ncbi:MAG: hypothetical protein OIF54_14345, partial [Cohaesibacter sp.]|nr:hypothetical protein [Cohaesibacter sp.]
LKILGLSMLALIVVAVAMPHVEDYTATSEGYLDATDKKLAKKAGYTSAKEWSKDRSDVLAKQRQERLALIEDAKQRLAEETRLKKIEAQKQLKAAQKAQEKQKAAKKAKEDARVAKLAAKLQRMTDSIISAFHQYYNFEAQPLTPGKPFCREGFLDCHIVAETFNIRIYGAGIVDVPTTTQSSHAHYREICAAVFSAISGSSLDFSAEAINGAYLKASQAGSFKHDLAGTQITIRPDSNGVMGCRFFKYGN